MSAEQPSPLTLARRALAEAIREALGEGTEATVHDHVPEELTGLDVVLAPAADALLPSETFDPREWVASLEVYVLVTGEDNAEVHDKATDLLPSVVVAMSAADWPPRSASRLVQYETQSWACYGISVTARRHIIL